MADLKQKENKKWSVCGGFFVCFAVFNNVNLGGYSVVNVFGPQIAEHYYLEQFLRSKFRLIHLLWKNVQLKIFIKDKPLHQKIQNILAK